MDIKFLLAAVGIVLIAAGALLMASQAIWPGKFKGAKRVAEGPGFKLQTNWPGFGLVFLGVILLLAAAVK